MKFQERTITLKDGRHCILRPVLPEYAEEMISYLKKTSAETDFLLRYPDEVTFTPEAERELLTKFYEDPRTVMMAAFVDGRLAGNGIITGVSTNGRTTLSAKNNATRAQVSVMLHRFLTMEQ